MSMTHIIEKIGEHLASDACAMPVSPRDAVFALVYGPRQLSPDPGLLMDGGAPNPFARTGEFDNITVGGVHVHMERGPARDIADGLNTERCDMAWGREGITEEVRAALLSSDRKMRPVLVLSNWGCHGVHHIAPVSQPIAKSHLRLVHG